MKKQLTVALVAFLGLWMASPALAEGFSSNQSSSGGSSSSSGGTSSSSSSGSSSSSSGGSGTSASGGSSSSSMKGDTNTVVRQKTTAESGPATSGSQIVGIDESSQAVSSGGTQVGGSTSGDSTALSGTGAELEFSQDVTTGIVETQTKPLDEVHVASNRSEAAGVDLSTIVMSLLMLLGFVVVYRKLPSAKSTA